MSDDTKIITFEELKKSLKDNPRYGKLIESADKRLSLRMFLCNELLDMKLDPLECILAPIFHKGDLMMIHGASGVGKSHFALNLAYVIAQGGNFLKYAVPIPKKVLYLDGEMGMRGIRTYLDPIINCHGKVVPSEDNLILVPYDQCEESYIPKLTDEGAHQYYIDKILKHKIDVVFLDNISTLTDLDENLSKEWEPIQRFLLKLRSKGVSVVILHHSGKNPQEQRGISKRIDILNTVISLQRIECDQDIYGERMKVVYQKHRNFHGEVAESFEATHHFTGHWSFRSIELSTMDKVVEGVRIGLKQHEIAKELNISRKTVYRAIKKAEELHLLS